MPTNALRDVDPIALTLCKQGANRQRIFLRKSTATDTLLTVANRMPILKAAGDDWTTFYCVVAVPGAEEDPGLVGDQDSTDVWENAEEIRKAAHRLLKNMAYVNTAHDGPAVDGVAIVESAVALAQFTVGDQTIPEGAWYVGIEPTTAEVRKSIEDGDIEAISLEGTGLRVPLEKSGEVTLTIPDGADAETIIREVAEGLRKQLATLGSTGTGTADQENDMGLADDIAALKKSHEESTAAVTAKLEKSDETTGQLIGLVGKLTERVEALASGGAKTGDGDDKTPVKKSDIEATLGDLCDKLDSFDTDLRKIAGDIAALAEGGSSQEGDDTPLAKSNGKLSLAESFFS